MFIDEMWPDGPRFIKDEDAFRVGTDSVLLSAFVGEVKMKTACDLGCGAGVISILLAWNNPCLAIDGIELQPEWACLARQNAALCGLSGRVNIIEGDVRRHRDFLKAGAYDLVIANPPYYPVASGKPAASERAAAAREERSCSIADICAAASYLTRWGGKFALVHKPERLSEVICALSSSGLEPKRLRFVQYRTGSAPNLFLVECRRGGNPSLTVEPPLILTDENGNDTAEVKRIYHRK